jgi:hypothetical protein
LPESALGFGEIDALFDEWLAVDVFHVDQITTNLLLIGAVREALAIETLDHQVQVAVLKLTLLVRDSGIALFDTIGLDKGDALLDHGNGLVLGSVFARHCAATLHGDAKGDE